MSSSSEWGQIERKQFQEDYNRRLRESGGYDVGDYVPDYDGRFPVRPVCLELPQRLEMMAKYSNLALEKYNMDNNTNYKLVKVLRATYGTGGAKRYFITFQVEDMTCPDSPTASSFRARLFDGWKKKNKVGFCGPEP